MTLKAELHGGQIVPVYGASRGHPEIIGWAAMLAGETLGLCPSEEAANQVLEAEINKRYGAIYG